jgi:hypothetical protein
VGAQEPTENELSNEWVSLFDGTTTSGWIIEGPYEIVNGTLVLGGGATAAARIDRNLGDQFELRLQYRLECAEEKHVSAIVLRDYVHRNFSRVNAVFAQLPVVADNTEWTEIVFQGEYDSDTDTFSVAYRYRPESQTKFLHGKFKTVEGKGSTEFALEVVPGDKLAIRNVWLRPDPRLSVQTQNLRWWVLLVPTTAVVGLIIILVLFLWKCCRLKERKEEVDGD